MTAVIVSLAGLGVFLYAFLWLIKPSGEGAEISRRMRDLKAGRDAMKDAVKK